MNDLFQKLEKFPSTRYQGSKRKLLPWISESLGDIEFNTVLDAFGGTGAVSYLFKSMGKEVTYNDVLLFNSIIGQALIENDSVIVPECELYEFLEFSSQDRSLNFISETFKGIYFTETENEWLDAVKGRLNQFYGDITTESVKFKKALLYYGIFQASLSKRPYNLFHRSNLEMRLRDVKRTFGNKTTWERSFTDQVKRYVQEANSAVFQGNSKCISLNSSAFSLRNKYDLVYFDPPYVSQNRDNSTIDYVSCYHFLEGYVNYENWDGLIDYSSKNKKFSRNLYENKFIKNEILHTFDELFELFQDSIIVLSYKNQGKPTIKEIVATMEKYKRNVIVKSIHYKYALNRQNGEAVNNAEVLLIGI